MIKIIATFFWLVFAVSFSQAQTIINHDVHKNIALGDALFTKKQLAQAKEKYQVALKIDETCKPCQVKIGECDKAIIPAKKNVKDLLIPTKKNGKYGYIDKTRKTVIPFIYEYAVDFHERLAWVDKNSKRGFIDTEGKIIVPLIYDQCEDFSEGLAEVKQ